MVAIPILFFWYPHHFSHKHAFTQVAESVRFDAERIKSTLKTLPIFYYSHFFRHTPQLMNHTGNLILMRKLIPIHVRLRE